MKRTIALIFASALLPWVFSAEPKAEILWDRWGIPHIFSQTEEDLFRAFGWAQAHSHAGSLLRAFGQARGRAAEYWGKSYLASDRWVRVNSVPARAERWYAAQKPAFRRNLDAFAAGINAYCRAHPSRIDASLTAVLPVTGGDVIAHSHRLIHYSYVTRESKVRNPHEPFAVAGSAAWAVAPKRSASGHALLLANPHTPWQEPFLFYEAQLKTGRIDVYGVAMVGSPVLTIAFNDYLGWTHTVNTLDADDLYELVPREGGYLWNGSVRPFDLEKQTIFIKDGASLRQEPLEVRRSVHGPVVSERLGRPLALRVAGLDQPFMLEQYWDMARARNLPQFERVLRRLQIPMFTVIYADRDGHIMHWFGGRNPVRPTGSWNWEGVVPGDTSATLWISTYPYKDLPKLVDPASGWLQNSNDAPWTTTFPQVLRRQFFKGYYPESTMDLRAQSAARAIMDLDRAALDDLIRLKHSSHMELADRLLPDLLTIPPEDFSQNAREGLNVLRAWNRTADNASRGAVLFQRFVSELRKASKNAIYRRPWDPAEPLTTPTGIGSPREAAAALDTAVSSVRKEYGSLDVCWGDVHRFQRAGADLPGNGAPGEFGILRVIGFTPSAPHSAFAGDSFTLAVEFSRTPRALAVLAYGNSSQPGSEHGSDQLPLMSDKRLRPVWRSREEILAHLKFRETP